MRTYDLEYWQLVGIARLCWQEQGSVPGAAAEASLMCNLYERRDGSRFGSLYDYVRDCGWWARASHWMDNGEASDQVVAAVADVVLNGNRTLPAYVDEHDCLADIESISTGDVADRSAYVRDRTVIRNRYGAVYTFYSFPGPGSDPFGYTSRAATPSAGSEQEAPPRSEAVGATDVVEAAISRMEAWAADDSHGYDQGQRWGERGDYDCSSAVITAWELAGVPVRDAGASYTGDMRDAFLSRGFSDVTGSISLPDGDGLERGDVLLNERHHVAMYCGNGMEVEASSNEDGGATGGRPGDQTGREFLIRPYRDYPWDCVLRYEGADSLTGDNFMEVHRGDVGAAVYLMQVLLRGRGYKGKDKAPLQRDGEAGENTIHALKKFQRQKGLDVDGVCGQLTWRYLLWDTGD